MSSRNANHKDPQGTHGAPRSHWIAGFGLDLWAGQRQVGLDMKKQEEYIALAFLFGTKMVKYYIGTLKKSGKFKKEKYM